MRPMLALAIFLAVLAAAPYARAEDDDGLWSSSLENKDGEEYGGWRGRRVDQTAPAPAPAPEYDDPFARPARAADPYAEETPRIERPRHYGDERPDAADSSDPLDRVGRPSRASLGDIQRRQLETVR